MENNLETCAVCKQSVETGYNFCPNCGNDLKEIIMPISTLAQVGAYAIAVLLPPLGLWPGIKYLKKKNPNAKKVGTITIVLTIISTIVSTWAIFVMFNGYVDQMNEIMKGI